MKKNIKDVYYLAVSDKTFLKALLKDPEKACANAKPEKLELSPEEMKLLKKSLSKKTSLTSAEMLGYLNSVVAAAGISSPVKPWPPPPPWWPKFVRVLPGKKKGKTPTPPPAS